MGTNGEPSTLSDGWYAGATETSTVSVEVYPLSGSVTLTVKEPLSATVAPSASRTTRVVFLVHVGKTLSTVASVRWTDQTDARVLSSTEMLYDSMADALFSTVSVTLTLCPGTATTC